MSFDFRMSQLLCSRLCHDLVGAASAVNAGIELLSEDQSDVSGPLDLMQKSATQLTERLSFYRVVFGSAGGADGPLAAEDIKNLAGQFLAEKKIAVSWGQIDFTGCTPSDHSDGTKLLLLMTIMASDCLPRGGSATLHAAKMAEGLGLAIEAFGTGVRVADSFSTALEAPHYVDHLSARNIHIAFAQHIAAAHNAKIEFSHSDQGVQLACLLVS